MRYKALALKPHAAAWRVVAMTGMVCLLLAIIGAGVLQAHPKDKRVIDIRTHAGGSYLGVTMQELTDSVREGLDLEVEHGVLINSVLEDSPAEKAGFQEGDVIVEFDGKAVDGPDKLKELLGETDIGEEVKVKVFRDGKAKTLRVTIGEWPDEPWTFVAPQLKFEDGKNWISYFMHGRGRLGVKVSDLDKDLASYFHVDAGEGVLVLSVEDETTAQEMGVKAGDVIVKLGDEEIRSVETLQENVGKLEKDEEFQLTVVRKRKRTTLSGKMKEGTGLYSFNGPGRMYAPMKIHVDRDELREEMKELRKEIEKLKKELKKMKLEESSF